jgi:hypothetical protein
MREAMRTKLHPRDFQVFDLSRGGMKGRMVAATVGLSLWKVLLVRLRVAVLLRWHAATAGSETA